MREAMGTMMKPESQGMGKMGGGGMMRRDDKKSSTKQGPQDMLGRMGMMEQRMGMMQMMMEQMMQHQDMMNPRQ
jgi:protein CpxP